MALITLDKKLSVILYYQIILQGNTNPYEVRINTLVDGVVADRVNFSLGPKQTETSCLRVEIYGKPCDNSTGKYKTFEYTSTQRSTVEPRFTDTF